MLNRGLDKLELLRIVEAVANEKSIDKELVIGSMESAIQKAALTKFGNDNNIEVVIDRESGEIKIQKVLEVVEKVEDPAREITLNDAKKIEANSDKIKVGFKIYEDLPSSNLKVLLTNRIDVVQDEVVSLLEKRGITFDEHMFIKGRDGNRSKGDRLKKLLRKYPDTKKVTFWDDKQKHIDDMSEKSKEFNNIKFNFNLVKK